MEYLTLTTDTDPTQINAAALTSATAGTYTFEVIATLASDSSNSASYEIIITVIDPCSIANLIDPGQPANPSQYSYLGSSSYEAVF